MDDARLDSLLRESAPPIAGRTARLREALSAVGAEARVTRRRRRGWALTAGLSGLLVVASAGAAAASPEVRQWLGWTPDRTISYLSTEGEACTAAFRLTYQQKQHGLVHSEAEVYETAMSAADRLDLTPARIAELVASQRAELQAADPASPWLALDAGDFEDWTVSETLNDALGLAFAERGIVRVDVASSVTCERAGR
ncbi:hypothetical protein [Agromyces soli]|uniref:Uncharacterized protein n=1 Tax=Agromyces soli TaxID=659012 RepID=A0ABY4ANH8_9MICO|nr:hypothetical protein [Agromyces soli]UOE24673.1 hypothetical protein MTP13_09830 [Agromyces soli]